MFSARNIFFLYANTFKAGDLIRGVGGGRGAVWRVAQNGAKMNGKVEPENKLFSLPSARLAFVSSLCVFSFTPSPVCAISLHSLINEVSQVGSRHIPAWRWCRWPAPPAWETSLWVIVVFLHSCFALLEKKVVKLPGGSWPSVLYNRLYAASPCCSADEWARWSMSVSFPTTSQKRETDEWNEESTIPGFRFWFGAYRRWPSLILCRSVSVRMRLRDKSQR